MKRELTAAVLALLCAAGLAPELLACGDKFLVPARAARFNKPAPPRDASILLYVNDASELFRTMNRLSVEATLQKAGYRPTVVRTNPELTNALSQRMFDLVVLDATDASRVDDSRRVSVGRAVLPVAYTVNGDQWKLAREQYPAAVKGPKNAGAFVEMIDAALDKHRAVRAKRP
jgi:hypothetical protein